MRPLLSSPSHLINNNSSILGCHVTFAIGAWNIRTVRIILVPTSHIQRVVGMLSILVAKSVPELSKVRIFVPDLVLESLGGDSDAGGHTICVNAMNVLANPASDGTACSCHICASQQIPIRLVIFSIPEVCLLVLSLYYALGSWTL